MKMTIIDPDTHSGENLLGMLQGAGISITSAAIVPTLGGGKNGSGSLSEKGGVYFIDYETILKAQLKNLPKAIASLGCTVFTSRYKESAIHAFEMEAFGFLLKPYDPSAVRKTAARIQRHFCAREAGSDLAVIDAHQKIAIPVAEGFRFVYRSAIVHCEADANFTWIYLDNGTKLITCRLLREMEIKLSGVEFLKIHRSHLVNLHKIEALLRGDGWELVLSNGRHVPIARDRKEAVVRALGVRK